MDDIVQRLPYISLWFKRLVNHVDFDKSYWAHPKFMIWRTV